MFKGTQMTGDGKEGEWLGSLLGLILRQEVAECSMLVAVDPVYLVSPVMTFISTLPQPKQVRYHGATVP